MTLRVFLQFYNYLIHSDECLTNIKMIKHSLIKFESYISFKSENYNLTLKVYVNCNLWINLKIQK